MADIEKRIKGERQKRSEVLKAKHKMPRNAQRSRGLLNRQEHYDDEVVDRNIDEASPTMLGTTTISLRPKLIAVILPSPSTP